MGQIKQNSFPSLAILTLIFITLKLCHVIGWSWFWVLSPTLIPLGIMAIIVILVGLGLVVIEFTD